MTNHKISIIDIYRLTQRYPDAVFDYHGPGYQKCIDPWASVSKHITGKRSYRTTLLKNNPEIGEYRYAAWTTDVSAFDIEHGVVIYARPTNVVLSNQPLDWRPGVRMIAQR